MVFDILPPPGTFLLLLIDTTVDDAVCELKTGHMSILNDQSTSQNVFM